MVDYKLLNMTEEIEMARIRKLLSLFLCLVMVLSFFPAAYAEGENEGTITGEQDCDHDHEEETQGTIAPVEEEPVGAIHESPDTEPGEDSVGDGVLDVPEDKELEPDLVRVEFICDPKDTVITVYDLSQLDEKGEPAVINPEENGTWLLTPGEYIYCATVNGNQYAKDVDFVVGEDEKSLTIRVSEKYFRLVDELAERRIGQAGLQFIGTAVGSTPYAKVVTSYTTSTTVGTIRYISQISSSDYFNWSYWPSSSFGYYSGPGTECGTASISMALSYVGVNKTPKNILEAYNGQTMFGVTWGNATYVSASLSTAISNYANGNGKYTPPVVHLPTYTTQGHYVVIAGQISSTQYAILDPASDTIGTMTISGTTWSYGGKTGTIDQVHQWHNPAAQIDNTYAGKCDVYPTWLTVTTTSGTSVMSQPCSSGTDSSSTQVKYLSKDSKFEVTDVYVNTYGVCWYKGKVVSSGEEGFLFSGNCSVTEYKTNRITASDNKYDPPTQLENPHGFYVTWLLSSEHLWLDYIWGDITNTETGESGLINKAEISNVRSLTYRLGSENSNEPVDANMPFSKLSPGHYIAQVSVKPVYYYGTGADGKTLSQYRKQTADRPISFSFDVVPQGTHVHDRGTYMYYEEAHPHRKCYQCSSCGTIWADSNSYTVLPGCADCRPEKPVLIGLEGTHNALEPVTFTWNDTARTTHYNIWIYKQNGSGEYEYYDHTNYVSSGYQLNCSVGNYKAELQAYNSDLWESDNSDWVHTTSDPTFFTVVMPTYIISYNANGGTGAPEPQEKLYDVTLTLSDTKPTRADEAAGSYTVTLDPRGGSVSSTKLTAARTTSYTFKNWNTAANGSGTAYNPGANYTANADVTLYAQWNSSTTTAAVTLPTPTRDGYSFKGWATSAAATSGMTGSYTPSGDVTLYAIWEQTTAGNLEILSVTGHPGKEILVPIWLSSNPGLYTINFHVNFDSTVLQLTGVEDGSLTGWSYSSKSSYIHWETPDDTDKTGTGVIVKLRFQILENAADGELTLSIDDLEAFNREEKAISFGRIPGIVTVSSRIAGDVNGDGEVSILDLVRFRKYLMHDTSDINASNADVTGDGSVNSQDLVRLRKYLVGDPTAVLD